jgi:hypothetical protein
MEQDLQLIEDYLAGKLSEEQQSAVQARLRSDAEFEETFKRERSMQAFLTKENKKSTLLPHLETLGEKHFMEEDTSEAKVVGLGRGRLWRGLAVAATVALLVLAIRFFLVQPSLYEQYAVHQKLSLVEKSDNIPTAAAAEAAFNQAKYVDAFELLGQYLEADPDNTRALLARGVSALELQHYEASANILNQIHGGSTALKYQGTWYLALLNLRQERFNTAIEYLEQIPASEGQLYERAITLIEELKN